MAGTDPPRALLSLIRDFASEKSQGERRVVAFKKQIEKLRSEIEAANFELDEAKRLKETTEQELKGFEVELALNEASILSLEGRISLIQEKISMARSEVEELKAKQAALRDEFINEMIEFNAKIRKFHATVASDFLYGNSVGNAAGDKFVQTGVTESALRTTEDLLAHVVSQIAKEEEEYIAEENTQKQVQQELVDIEKKVSLMEAIMQQTIALQELTRQTSELETIFASLSNELQKRCICPSCHLANLETLGGILQENEAK